MIKTGNFVRDKITGIEGQVIAYTSDAACVITDEDICFYIKLDELEKIG